MRQCRRCVWCAKRIWISARSSQDHEWGCHFDMHILRVFLVGIVERNIFATTNLEICYGWAGFLHEVWLYWTNWQCDHRRGFFIMSSPSKIAGSPQPSYSFHSLLVLNVNSLQMCKNRGRPPQKLAMCRLHTWFHHTTLYKKVSYPWNRKTVIWTSRPIPAHKVILTTLGQATFCKQPNLSLKDKE